MLHMLDSDGIIGTKLCLMMEVLAVSVRNVCTRTAHHQIAMGSFFFEVLIHVDSFRFSDHLCPELIESPRISVREHKFINATR